jgi:hypothetical protein
LDKWIGGGREAKRKRDREVDRQRNLRAEKQMGGNII